MRLIIKIDNTKGRGVYADQKILEGSLVEVCQLIILALEEVSESLEGYVYEFNKKQVAIALGNGSLYNHHPDPNAEYFFNYKKKLLHIVALKDINKGEEITVNYGYNQKEKLRFNIKE